MNLIQRLRRLEAAAASAPSFDPDQPPANWWGWGLVGTASETPPGDDAAWCAHVEACRQAGRDPWAFDEFLKYAVRR